MIINLKILVELVILKQKETTINIPIKKKLNRKLIINMHTIKIMKINIAKIAWHLIVLGDFKEDKHTNLKFKFIKLKSQKGQTLLFFGRIT